MAITFKDFQNIHGTNISGRARKMQSDMIMLKTWWQDIQAQNAYIYDYYHDLKSVESQKLNDLHPEEDEQKTVLPIKFIRHASQTYDKDQVTFWLQMQPGQECNLDYYDKVLGKRYNTLFPIGCFIDIKNEDGTYNKWLIVDKANHNGNQFPTFEILRCDFIARWVFNGHKYSCPAVLRSQNSYNSGIWLDFKQFRIPAMVYCNSLNCWKFLRANIPKRSIEIICKRNVLKNIGLDNQQPSPDEGKVQRLCGSSESCGENLIVRD